MEFLNIQSFRDLGAMARNYCNVTLFDHIVTDAMDQVYSNHYASRDFAAVSDDVRPRKLRYNINKRKWSV